MKNNWKEQLRQVLINSTEVQDKVISLREEPVRKVLLKRQQEYSVVVCPTGGTVMVGNQCYSLVGMQKALIKCMVNNAGYCREEAATYKQLVSEVYRTNLLYYVNQSEFTRRKGNIAAHVTQIRRIGNGALYPVILNASGIGYYWAPKVTISKTNIC